MTKTPILNPLTSLVFLAGFGGLLGGGQALMGLLLGAGGMKFVVAVVVLGGLTWAASRGIRQPGVALALKLSGRVSGLTLTAVSGVGVGLLWLGRAEANALSSLWLAVGLALPAIVSGVCAGASAQPDLERRWRLIAMALALLAGLASGAALGQYFTWTTAKFFVWGVLSGAGLGLALSWLIQPGPRQHDTAGTRWPEHGALFLVILLVLFNSALPQAWNDTGVFN